MPSLGGGSAPGPLGALADALAAYVEAAQAAGYYADPVLGPIIQQAQTSVGAFLSAANGSGSLGDATQAVNVALTANGKIVTVAKALAPTYAALVAAFSAALASLDGGGGGSSLTSGGPFPPSIGNLSTGQLRNFSGVGHNVAKLVSGKDYQFYDCAPPLPGYTESWHNGEGGRATRFLVGPWSQWRGFRTYLLGYTVNLPNPNDPAHGLVSRSIPSQHPVEPQLYVTAVDLTEGRGAAVWDPNVYVLGPDGNPLPVPILDAGGNVVGNPVNGVPDGRIPFIYYAQDQGGTLFDGQAVLKVEYGHYPYLIKDDATVAADSSGMGEAGRNVAWEYAPALQAIQVPPSTAGQQLMFVGTTTPIPGNPTLLLPTASLKAVWYDVPDIPHATIRACTGKTNPDKFPPAAHPLYGDPFDPDKLLMQPPKFENYRTPLGAWSRKVTFEWLYRESGWSSFPNGFGDFKKATFGGTSGGKLLYPTPANGINFIDLFKMPPPQNYQ